MQVNQFDKRSVLAREQCAGPHARLASTVRMNRLIDKRRTRRQERVGHTAATERWRRCWLRGW